jgi:YidC/Oxa1 family membrane protein insertase
MGKQEITGFVLIAAVLMAWMYFTSPQRKQPQDQNIEQHQTVNDSIASPQKKDSAKPAPVVVSPKKEIVRPAQPMTDAEKDTLGRYFHGTATGHESVFTIETKNYIAELSTKGGQIKKWTLKKYDTWDNYPVQLVNGSGDLNLLFSTTDGKLIDTKGLYFSTQIPPGGKVVLSDNDEYTVSFVLKGTEGSITKKLTFKNDKYDIDADFIFTGMKNVIANYEYQVLWENGIRYCEYNSVDESNSAAAYSFGGGEMKEINASSADEVVKAEPDGATDWVAMRNKYFAVAFLSDDKKATGAYLEGHHILAENQGVVEKYSIAIKYPYKEGDVESSKMSIYIGPLDFQIIKGYHRELERIMSLGWSWIRPITEYIFIPFFHFLHLFISNYGLVIIIFSIAIKLVLHPLTKTSMRSMRNMQKLQPIMAELKEKYKNDPQQMNAQTMKLYKDYGVNPAGGCLPMIIQLPILYALYALFSASIELRHAPFVGWITDLSVPDVLISLPVTLPFLGNYLSGLTLAMGITMFVQQRQTVTDPTQKAMIWMMPIMMTILFNHFPSGLNLYYFVFNILSIGQQYYFNRIHKSEPLQKIPEGKRKSGFVERMMKNMEQQKKK